MPRIKANKICAQKGSDLIIGTKSSQSLFPCLVQIAIYRVVSLFPIRARFSKSLEGKRFRTAFRGLGLLRLLGDQWDGARAYGNVDRAKELLLRFASLIGMSTLSAPGLVRPRPCSVASQSSFDFIVAPHVL